MRFFLVQFEEEKFIKYTTNIPLIKKEKEKMDVGIFYRVPTKVHIA